MDESTVSAICEAFRVPHFLMGHMPLTRTNSYEDAPLDQGACGAEGCPVVLFAHSLGGLKMQNCALMEELASHGYLVLACDFPHDASLVVYPDGGRADFLFLDTPDPCTPSQLRDYRRQCIQLRAEDVRFLRHQLFAMRADPSDLLARAVDPYRVSLLGHSYGGGTVVHVAQQDLSVRGVMVLDGWLWCNHRSLVEQGLSTPMLSLRSPTFMDERDVFCSTNHQLFDLLCRRTPHCRSVVLPIGHYDYTDMIWISPILFRTLGLMSCSSRQRLELHRFISDSCLGFLAEVNPSAAVSGLKLPTSMTSLDVSWQNTQTLPEEGEWTTMQVRQLQSILDTVVKEGSMKWEMMVFPDNLDLAVEVQVCSSARLYCLCLCMPTSEFGPDKSDFAAYLQLLGSS